MAGKHAANPNNNNRSLPGRRPAPSSGFVPLTKKIGASSPRRMPDSLSARSIKERLRGEGVKQGGQGVINDLVEELNGGIRPTDDYSMRSVLQTLHTDVATGKEVIDFDIAKQEAKDYIERLKATLPEGIQRKIDERMARPSRPARSRRAKSATAARSNRTARPRPRKRGER